MPNKSGSQAGCWRLYLLQCRDGTLYTGITNDIIRRVAQHNKGTASRYTRSRLPVRLIFDEKCRNKSCALRKEYRIKSLSRKEKEEYIMAGKRMNSAAKKRLLQKSACNSRDREK